MPPLDGLTVVSLEQAVAAPFATRQLADLGARVIKIERPGVGDFARSYDRSVLGQASYFVWLNRGKESVELDLKRAEDLAVLNRIVESADVVVQNLLPGSVDRMGLDASTLRALNPRLIHCSISGYGGDGPQSHRKAYDLLIQCETGLLAVTGTKDEPCKSGISIADIAAGMYAYSSILTALYARERTGVGATLEVAMIDALGEWMSQPLYYAIYDGSDPVRSGARHASIAPYGPYRTKGGALVFLGVQNDREWKVLCEKVLQRPDLVTDSSFARNPERVVNDHLITPVIESTFASLEADEVIEMLDGAGIACARLRSPTEFASHPQLSARHRFQSIRTPRGPVQAMLPPAMSSEWSPYMGSVPALGEHTESIRTEFAGA
jgi:itaconate CoA-transferase